MSNDLPESWRFSSVERLATIGSGQSSKVIISKCKTEGEVPWFKVSDMNLEGNEKYMRRSQNYLSNRDVESLGMKVFPAGAVIFPKRGGAISTNKKRILTQPSCIDSNTMALTPRGCSSDYFWLWFCTVDLGRLSDGSNIPQINNPDILPLEVPLPPLAEQRRIVAKLEKLFSQVGACKQRLARIPLLLKRFRQSVLAAACSGRLTADWREENGGIEPASIAIEQLKLASSGAKVRRGVPENVPMPDVVADWDLPPTWGCYSTADLLRCGAFVDVKDGNHGANHPKVSEFTKTGLPFITAAQVNNFRVDYDSAYKLSGEPLNRIHVGFAKPGDVIYTHKGSVGRIAIADRECVLTPQTTYYRVNPKAFSNGFVMFYLASRAFCEQADIVKEQTTRDFVPISEQYLLFHRVPPLSEQQEIVRRVGSLFALADRLEARFAEGRKRVDSITQSILAKAFRGELVPTEFELAKAEGRSFESADELLTRIGTANEVGRNGNGAKARKQQNKRND